MKFKLWLEDTMNRDKAVSLVLNAIDVPENDAKIRNDIMSVPVRAYPHLAEKLSGMAELQPHASEISGWINSKMHTPTTIQQVIEFISNLDIINEPKEQGQQQQPQGNMQSQGIPQQNQGIPQEM